MERESERSIQVMLRQLIIANNLLCARTRTFPISLHYDFKLFTFMSSFWYSFANAADLIIKHTDILFEHGSNEVFELYF